MENEFKIKDDKFQSLAIRLLAANLITSRKMCDLIIVHLAHGTPDLLISLAVGFRQETEAAIQVLIDKIYENAGDISIDDILGKES